jgi:2-polyprenyl-3-methyl-5-hydroxy-6-metoxy-1,4-benzoquinol methylase
MRLGENKNTMQFLYKNALFSRGEFRFREINDAAIRLYTKLKGINVDSLNISDYNKRYFGNHLNNLRSSLQLYSFILAWSISDINLPPENCTILDYGGGSGIFSLLAKELNFGTVLYNDIYDVSCQDAKTIGSSIGNQADHYILGDIDDTIIFLEKNGIKCNSIVSYDVIEHMYDIEYFIKKLPELTDQKCSTVVMCSSANPYNPFIVHRRKKGHYQAEFEDKNEHLGRKKRDALESYRMIRKRIIQRYCPDLNTFEIEEISARTRGMIEGDIINAVHEYKLMKRLPPEPVHPTNTCDPYTGNWAEHLMDINQLKMQLQESGFRSKIFAGYFGNSDQKGKIMNNIIVPGLNTLINLPKCGICLAPFFTLYGIRCTEEYRKIP